MDTATSSAILASQMQVSDWINLSSTLLLASTAFVAPYVVERWKMGFRRPKLSIEFELEPPYCHKTESQYTDGKNSVYYFRFGVKNIGKSEAESCEVFLEEIYKENSAGEYIKEKNFSPVNLKWSGRDETHRSIYPEKSYFCDLGHINHPSRKFTSAYHKITKKEQESNKFIFELPFRYFSQWDCLVPGKYQIKISIYSKNAEKVSKTFQVSWSGNWEEDEEKMFRELVIK